jgi:hypothetical protein
MYPKGRLRRNGYRVGWVLVAFFATVFLPALAQTTDWASLIQAAKPAVVWILAETPKGTSAGSGAIISPDGYILTAAHVIEGASRIKVVVEETREYWASVVNADYKADVAVLKISASDLTWLALGDSDTLALDQEIRLLGYPRPEIGFGLIIGRGFFLGRRKTADVELLQLQVDPFDRGHSGGPILDTHGEIVGVAVGAYVIAERIFPDLKDSPVIVREHKLAVAVNSAKRLIPPHVLPTVPSPEILRTLSGHHMDSVLSVAFSPDGKILASGSADRTIKLWDVATGKELRTLSGHTSYVLSVAFSPDGKILASGSGDRTINLWDVSRYTRR